MKYLRRLISFIIQSLESFITLVSKPVSSQMPDDGESEELQDEFELSGVVKNRTTQEAVAGVQVNLQEEKVGATTNGEGKFSFMLKPGCYTLTVDIHGFKEWSKEITLVKGEPNTKQISAELVPSLKKVE